MLEPLDRRHAADLWLAAQCAEESWSYLGYGPFPSQDAMADFIAGFAGACDPMTWAVRPVDTGVASAGWRCWTFSRGTRRSSSAASGSRHACNAPVPQPRPCTCCCELAADQLGYRRLVWKCNALNAPSRRAAERLGFTYEGRHRMHMVVKGRSRDTDWYGIVGDEWRGCCDALEAWLDPANYFPDGAAKQSLAVLRGERSLSR